MELVVDDPTGFRCVLVSGTVAIREDIETQLPHFRAIREKYGVSVQGDAEHLAALRGEERVLLVITPDKPVDAWTEWEIE